MMVGYDARENRMPTIAAFTVVFLIAQTQSGAAASPAPAPVPTIPEKPALPPNMVSATFETSMYGFVEFNVIRDSTQSFNEAEGNTAIARPGTLPGDHGRTQFSIRDSRLGFKLKGPGSERLNTSGVLEMDFYGNQPQGSPAPAGSPAVSEMAYFTSPGFRARHYFVKLATPYVDILAGQTWSLFGWQGSFFANVVQIPGVPGALAARTQQLRLSHLFRGRILGLEIAVAAARPAQRNSDAPDGVGGLRLILNDWKGLRTFGATGTGVDPLSIGVSGMVRRFRIPEFSATPKTTNAATGWGISLDALLPVIRTTGNLGESALTLTGSYVRGRAISDQYTCFTGGASFPALATGTYAQDVDNGLVAYSPDGVLHTIGWQSFIVGAQYYPPLPIRAWVSVNFSHIESDTIKQLITPANTSSSTKIFDKTDWADMNVFVDANTAVRFGLEYAFTRQTYLDGVRATNHRVQLSTFYMF